MKPRDGDPKQQTPPAPPVVWPNDEGRSTVVQANQGAWQRHTKAARQHRESAEHLGAEIYAKGQDLEKLRQEQETLRQGIDMLIQEQRQQDHYAGQEQGAADAYAVALAALGEQLPPPQDRLVAGTPGMSPLEAAAHAAAWKDMAPTGFHQTLSASPQGDPQEHAAAFGGAFSPHAERPADGYCINCGEPVWREPVHPENAPKGAKHGFGASCTNDPNQVADLGDTPGPLR
ncbi:hypothetical protein OG884_18395 [Streptosporangium sp. NBC_01755]|uniref:hypothetical protein n=1 Tax=Streptosporangium sp. NBC_01755 TaxID=2975949 RepID=UPI002DD9E7B8|nr:hypothetical protein [Streptosporangium sp. NBC_01755]WSD03777.1 hypothetical protein OG884_18395 [Streptosporangium sp. NBC_01755]